MDSANWRGSAGAVIFMLMVFGAGWYTLHLADVQIRQDLKREIDKEKGEIDKKWEDLQKEVREAIQQMRPTHFGKWEPHKVNTPYEAKTDGFVSVAVSGVTLGFNIEIWPEDPSPGQPPILLARGNQHDGVVAPIPKGTLWQVEFHTRNGKPVRGPISIHWMPILRAETPTSEVEQQ